MMNLFFKKFVYRSIWILGFTIQVHITKTSVMAHLHLIIG